MSLVGSSQGTDGSVGLLPLSGSWSNRKMSASHAEDPGATPGDST